MSENKLLNVIVRFHDDSEKNLQALSFCLFCLNGQDYKYIQPIIVLQGFSNDAINRVNSIADEIVWEENKPIIHNVVIERKGDYRSKLINEGFKLSTGKYLAILDFDDIIYGDAYSYLIGKLQNASNNIVATFGNIKRVDCVPMDGFLYQLKKIAPFYGNDKFDFFVENFCPIHSFVLDRTKISKKDLYFDESMSKNEDYHFLMRLIAKYEVDFSTRKKYVGEYVVRTDGSNTINSEYRDDASNIREQWDKAAETMHKLRESTLTKVKISELVFLKNGASNSHNSFDHINNLQRHIDNKEHELSTLRSEHSRLMDDFAKSNSDLIEKNIILEQLFQTAYLNEKIETNELAGYIDSIETKDGLVGFNGWAIDVETREKVLSLAVVIGNKIHSIHQTTLPRDDIAKLLSVINDSYGFFIQIPFKKIKNLDEVRVLALQKTGVIFDINRSSLTDLK